ncbi:dioxygenase family protein [Kangiella aquimarina]|uniref:Intradiol ring-cleavage dioxygenases domain-containing protein n=1 Tax=Kangiella aquimarina TaxID=261965 RepID=A0ABZ0X4V1_9GAMM|nr:hypothetical protein [Kangiella aquimarina]WQG85588.1 hypothetical protein SR900_01590 [Kangiella aquimarina]
MFRLMTFYCLFLTSIAAYSAQEAVIGGPCQGCELVFVGMPDDVSSSARIAPVDEPGEALIVKGTVYKKDGTPAKGIIVYAYQTDDSGKYPKGSTSHGRLRGWARTNQAGQYEFMTIRPKAYPGRDIPQHIHMHIIEPDKATYYIDDITFDDDPLLTAEKRSNHNCRGGCADSKVERNEQGVWQIQRDIILGEGVQDYK